MTGKIVFPEPSVDRDGPLGWAEPGVNFYLESTRPQAVAARAWINAAYQRFPDDEKGTFAGRLRSADETQHYTAMDELFVHDQLIRVGRVVHEEDGKGPDFRIYREDTYIGAVEVCSLFENREWFQARQRHARIADELQKHIPLEQWYITFDLVRLHQQPSLRRIATWVKQQMAALPSVLEDPRMTTSPVTYQTDDVELRFRFIRRVSNSAPKPTDRVVMNGQISGGMVDSYLRLRSALEKKVQKRYETRGKPLAIFVGTKDWACSLDQFEDALVGNEQILISSGEVGRANNGFFGRNKERPSGKHQDISCVFAARNWLPWEPENFTTLRFDNPFATHEFPNDLLPADHTLGLVRNEQARWLEWMPSRPTS